MGAKDQPREILGKSKPVIELLKLIDRVSSSKTNVLIIGESGTGKELVAQRIHDSGPLRGRPFIPVNCGAIPETLIESEMFGHKRGSFTGAVAEKTGLFEAANGGTLFLDEVGELPLAMQVKLLRAIQERVVRKVGGTEDTRVDARIIAATNRDLEAGVAKGTFREDLYYRLNVLLIRTPPLRERKGDVKLLAEHFLIKYSEAQSKPLRSLAPAALLALEQYGWPGNVRELENVIERAVTLSNSGQLEPDALPTAVLAARTASCVGQAPATAGGTAGAGKGSAAGSAAKGQAAAASGELRLPAPDLGRGPIEFEKIIADVERIYIQAALDHAGGNRRAAADLLKLNARSLRHRMTRLGMGSDGETD